MTSWLFPRQTAGNAELRSANADFGAGVSALSATIFTFALLMQGVASLVLTGCER
ncbi:hypothetical protein ACVWXQ_000547 [Bradyrhizobium sp. S3.14.4]